MTEFRHKIGDALYQHWMPYDCNDPETIRYPIVKLTERYAWVMGRYLWQQEHGTRIRFSRDDLECTGHAWNLSHHLCLYTKPGADWPLMRAVVRKSQPLELEGTDA